MLYLGIVHPVHVEAEGGKHVVKVDDAGFNQVFKLLDLVVQGLEARADEGLLLSNLPEGRMAC